MSSPDAVPVRDALARLSEVSFLDHSLESVLRLVAEQTARLVPGELSASLTVLTSTRPRTVATTDQLALDLDEVQYRLGTGPCLQAASSGRPVEIPDLRAEGRFGEFAGAAAERGCQGILSIPFPRPSPVAVLGGLNMYLRGTGAWAEAARRRAARYAETVVVVLANRYLYQSVLERSANLEAALSSRAVIDQAKGILMERHKLSADQAFQALARVSMEANVKLRDIADQVVDTGVFRLP